MPSTIIPSLRYRDAHAAIAFLEAALGFKKKAVYEGPNNTVAHAELTLGDGMIMIGSYSGQGEFAHLVKQPDEIDLAETQAPYVLVKDAAALFAQAVAAGATIVKPLEQMSYGGAAFTIRDPEGHLWAIGEYDPWPAAS
ncbi:VOC family protein [Granulicella sibirica]|uniref:Glyoxalase/bleomycin resistance protein/dioxygenase n=1 Tax=Granulicella sibirica TaxID=2479048 RepID=A0A4Q0SYX6_9BACT|nr:VOC family protein [Granulicella sibirica]RXH54256.1 Glyoxalase/bleomycin resistance protein/dioxygenase [Granulicella sibirica]